MITGVVTADLEPVVRIAIRGPQGQEREIEALVDTGFNGWLSLPTDMIAMLGLPWRRRGRALLADGSESVFDIYEATVIWDGNGRRVAVDAADTAPMVGTALLDGYELVIQVIDGGEVRISVLP